MTGYYVNVSFIVINHVRTFHVTYDHWGRPTYEPQCTTWISFWSIWWTPRPGFPAVAVPRLVARGWWTMSSVRILRCTEGWLVEPEDGINVIAPVLLVIDSPYDWEMRNRRIFRPIRKP